MATNSWVLFIEAIWFVLLLRYWRKINKDKLLSEVSYREALTKFLVELLVECLVELLMES